MFIGFFLSFSVNTFSGSRNVPIFTDDTSKDPNSLGDSFEEIGPRWNFI